MVRGADLLALGVLVARCELPHLAPPRQLAPRAAAVVEEVEHREERSPVRHRVAAMRDKVAACSAQTVAASAASGCSLC